MSGWGRQLVVVCYAAIALGLALTVASAGVLLADCAIDARTGEFRLLPELNLAQYERIADVDERGQEIVETVSIEGFRFARAFVGFGQRAGLYALLGAVALRVCSVWLPRWVWGMAVAAGGLSALLGAAFRLAVRNSVVNEYIFWRPLMPGAYPDIQDFLLALLMLGVLRLARNAYRSMVDAESRPPVPVEESEDDAEDVHGAENGENVEDVEDTEDAMYAEDMEGAMYAENAEDVDDAESGR